MTVLKGQAYGHRRSSSRRHARRSLLEVFADAANSWLHVDPEEGTAAVVRELTQGSMTHAARRMLLQTTDPSQAQTQPGKCTLKHRDCGRQVDGFQLAAVTGMLLGVHVMPAAQNDTLHGVLLQFRQQEGHQASGLCRAASGLSAVEQLPCSTCACGYCSLLHAVLPHAI
jgi:hypothetical protein